jgi:V8-like Glu-specific endopeptidase
MKTAKLKSLSIAVLSLLGCVMATGAFAQKQTGPVAGQREADARELSNIENYWTEERMRNAIPREKAVTANTALPTGEAIPNEGPIISVPGKGSVLPPLKSILEESDSEGAAQADEEGFNLAEEQVVDDGLSATDPLAWGTYPYPYTSYYTPTVLKNTFPYKAVGKLFFTLGGSNWVCSASVIRPHLLLTARHCIYDYPTGRWASNVMFYPGYSAGSNPTLGGGWAGRVLTTWTSGASALQYDIGFIQTYNKNRTGCKPTATNPQIESYTGYLGYRYGGSYDKRHFDPMGYPAASPWGGSYNAQCETSTGALAVFGQTNTFEVGCNFTGGSSGGPWLEYFKPGVVSNSNYAVSLTSFGWTNPPRPLATDGPQFQQWNFYNLLVAAQAIACP